MLRAKTIFFILVFIGIFGYTGSWWGGGWFTSEGNTYFHFAGGFFVAALIASYYASEFGKLSQPLRFFCILGMTMGVGVFWEFHEYAIGHLISVPLQGDLADTMKDLLVDTFGGAVVGILYMFRRRNTQQS